MYFSHEALKGMEGQLGEVHSKFNALREVYITRKYNSAHAEEYATQGFSRRISTLSRCIQIVFDIIPPDRNELPTREELLDATINIQAFIFNVFGCVDNLAWVWVSEKNLKTKAGEPLPNRLVGLSKKHKKVRDSFPIKFQEYLKSRDDWFEHIMNFRHALAHRIPLYIPPLHFIGKK